MCYRADEFFYSSIRVVPQKRNYRAPVPLYPYFMGKRDGGFFVSQGNSSYETSPLSDGPYSTIKQFITHERSVISYETHTRLYRN